MVHFTLDYINRRSIVNPLRAVMHVLVSDCHQSGKFLECAVKNWMFAREMSWLCTRREVVYLLVIYPQPECE